MNKNSFIIFLVLMSLLATACNNQEKNEVNKILEFDYKIVELKNIEDEKIINWYEDNKRNYGFYKYKVSENQKYLLISAGERKTGGYSLKVDSVNELNGLIEFTINLDKPSSDEMVTQAITYPNLLIKVDSNQNFKLDAKLNFDKGSSETKNNIIKFKKVKGEYIGQIDNNFIEVDISNDKDFKEKSNYKNDFLSLKILKGEKEKIKKMESGDIISFTCYKDKNNTWVIEDIIID